MRGVERCFLLQIKGNGTIGPAVHFRFTFVKPTVRGLFYDKSVKNAPEATFHFTPVFFSNFRFGNYSNFTLSCERYIFKT